MLLKTIINKILYFDPLLDSLFGDWAVDIVLRFKAIQFLIWLRKLKDRINPGCSRNMINLDNQFRLLYLLLVSERHQYIITPESSKFK